MKLSDVIHTVVGEYKIDLSERNADGGIEKICLVCNTWNGINPYMDRMIEQMCVDYTSDNHILFLIVLLPEKVGQAIEELTKISKQSSNKIGKKPLLIAYNGEQHSLKEWSEITGISINTLKKRYYTYGKRGDELFFEWEGRD